MLPPLRLQVVLYLHLRQHLHPDLLHRTNLHLALGKFGWLHPRHVLFELIVQQMHSFLPPSPGNLLLLGVLRHVHL